MTLTLTVVALVVLLALYVTWTAGRLDRLHARVDAAWAALDAALVRRAAAAREVAAREVAGDRPGLAEVRVRADAALRAGPVDREGVENALTRALRAADLPAGAARQELVAASSRVALARALHNGAVSDARVVRRRRVVRALHLAGYRTLPRHFDIDDAPVPESGDAPGDGPQHGLPHRPPQGPPHGPRTAPPA